MTPNLDDPMMAVIGTLVEKAQNPPQGTPELRLAWRVGYQNAMSDLIAELYPEADGGRRLSMEEIALQDRLRAG